MSESLGDLLRRTADAAPEPRVDVGELVGQAGLRQRRRRLADVATAAAVVGAIVVGSFALRGGPSRDLEPAPPPSDSPSVVDSQPTGERPLVYAAGTTVHVGDDSFDAGGTVEFLDATDDGVVYATNDGDRSWPHTDTLWFNDGSTTEVIGRMSTGHVGDFFVQTANPGSLVVWTDATSNTFVVYDTSRHEVVRLPPVDEVLHVVDSQVFFIPDSARGCWVDEFCNPKHVLRYDLASGTTERIAEAAYEAELSTDNRMLVLAGATDRARFTQVGRRLVPVDSNGNVTRYTRTTGESVRLSLPAGYIAPRRKFFAGEGGPIPLVQWLDDDRVVLFPNEGAYDSHHEVGDLLVCRLPDGTCRVAVRASSTLYVAPGTNW